MAETKKVKVLDVAFNREYTSNGRTTFYFNMKVQGPDGEIEGQFSTNKREQTKFSIGTEYDITIETKQNNRGPYFFFDKPKSDQSSSGGGYKGGGGGSGWVRPRKDVVSIISQSSYEAAALIAVKVGKDLIKSHTGIAAISKQLTNYIVEVSGLNSDACKKNDKEAMKAANERSIVYQKALKIAVICLDMTHMEETLATGVKFHTTQGIISVTDMICNDINRIASEV